ncbi:MULTISPECIES: Crp/Fnr family transcriptional regulator [Myroides]|uniref:Crp/Fnr family transcriptional regulator n=1 Tax=Myroides TaxID=76831 RepID=UPI000280A7C7|nr:MULTISPECIES: Crp/Fnr family transcriptional regulator [Myroides]APA91033.1 cyclic nucleotide-binding protein [Myroides sp. ZB35]EKB02208.1 hypothetical protein HMPREF9711_03414 [Myroides odoratimimus CCUG 3837]
MQDFLKQIHSYYSISEETQKALLSICKIVHYKKNDLVLRAGDLARYYYYIREGLLGYYSIDEQGNTIYKIFFEEKSFVASTSAIIEHKPSDFSIVALEDTALIIYPAQEFRDLVHQYHDLALFQINYLERNWVVKKEPLEINLKWESAKQRYIKLYENQRLYNRLKQHQIASYLGITPTQLSRIRKELNF